MASTSTSTLSSRAYFEQQRESLIREIAMSFEHVLANVNKLNRNLEAVIAVGNEFSSVEALWSTFENVMGKEEGEGEKETETETEGGVEKQEEQQQQEEEEEEEGGDGHSEEGGEETAS